MPDRRPDANTIQKIILGVKSGLPVNSSYGHVVTRLTRDTRVSSQSHLVTSEHIRKPYQSQFFYLHADQVAPINSAEHGKRNYGKRVYTRHTQCCAVRFAYLFNVCISKSPMTMKLLNATNARSKSTVNSSQRLQT